MFGPCLLTRIEQRLQFIGFGIVTGWIWTFEQTARGAAPRKVLLDGWTIMLLWPDVVEMKRARIVVLWKLAVFAASFCSFDDLLA